MEATSAFVPRHARNLSRGTVPTVPIEHSSPRSSAQPNPAGVVGDEDDLVFDERQIQDIFLRLFVLVFKQYRGYLLPMSSATKHDHEVC